MVTECPLRTTDIPRLRALLARVAVCRACQDAGLLGAARPITAEPREARIIVIGQAPGPVTHREGIHFAGPAGRTLAGWLEAAGFPPGEAHKFPYLSSAWLTSLTRCFPGPSASGNGDRAPSPKELALCRPFLDEEIAAVDPDVIVLVGAMAIRGFLGPMKLDDAVGQRFERDGRAVIPFPHSSGVSRWGNLPANKAKIASAVDLLRIERERLGL
ncbi:MAG: uracil-DNA glycosylase [Chloroflexota bacterium]|nr:uracil-DNA glycosylase [Chloroflexota bacterium]